MFSDLGGMSNLDFWARLIFCSLGAASGVLCVALVVRGALELWISCRNRFCDILHGESMIYQYRKHRQEIDQWLKEMEEKEK